MTESRPLVVVIAGPNGAGKSTLAPALLRDGYGIRDFVNADEIARGLSGFDPASMALPAGRVMLDRLRELAASQVSFAFETTLATRSYAPWLQELSGAGYRVELCFFWLPSVEMSVTRVANRVRAGGHDIPEETIRRRYDSGLRNFFALYQPLAARWAVFDNSRGTVLRSIASGSGVVVESLDDPETWNALTSRYGRSEGP